MRPAALERVGGGNRRKLIFNSTRSRTDQQAVREARTTMLWHGDLSLTMSAAVRRGLK